MSAPGRRDQLWLTACPPSTVMELDLSAPNLWLDFQARCAVRLIGAEGGWAPGRVTPAVLAATVAWPYGEWPRYLAGLDWRHSWWRQESPVEGDHR